MIIYLLQHGEAVTEEIDPARPLTDKGRNDVEQSALDLKKTSGRN